MKIAHSFIVLTSVIFVTGSMLTVGMDLKATTDNVSTNVIEAKQKHVENKDANLIKGKKQNKEVDNEIHQMKTLYKVKLESLNQDNSYKSKNAFLPGKRI